jgi:hypothetical protein
MTDSQRMGGVRASGTEVCPCIFNERMLRLSDLIVRSELDPACLYLFNSFTRLGQNSDTNRRPGCQASLVDGSAFPILGGHPLDNLAVL